MRRGRGRKAATSASSSSCREAGRARPPCSRWLAVEGALRGSGIGRELLFRGIEACRQRGRNLLRAHAYAVSPAACRLYWLYGFGVAGLEAFPVGSGVRERIVFEKRLNPPATTA